MHHNLPKGKTRTKNNKITSRHYYGTCPLILEHTAALLRVSVLIPYGEPIQYLVIFCNREGSMRNLSDVSLYMYIHAGRTVHIIKDLSFYFRLLIIII